MSISPIARLRSRYVSLIAVLSVLITLVIFLIGFSVRVLKDVPFRQAFVVTTNPMRIISWDRQRTAMQIVSLPKDILIEGAFGYGQYSLTALEALDVLDHKDGLLLIQSVAQAVGVPISGAIIVDSTESEASALDSLKKIFSWRSIAGRVFGRIGTTISVSDWIHIVLILHALGTDDVEVLDLSSATGDVARADGVVIRILDPQKVDFILANSLHDAKIRDENKTITIINTTSIVGIGSSIARIISRFGIQVVSVGNQSQQIVQCELETDKSTKLTKTYQFLKSYLGCEEKLLNGESGVSDITLRIGSSYAE